MDNFAKAGGASIACAVLCPVAVLGTMLGIFSWYTFGNPDGVECWAGAGDTISPVQDELHTSNVTSKFHTYFLINFISYVYFITNMLVAVIAMCSMNPALFKLAQFVGYGSAVNGCLQFAMLIVGPIFRWNHEGKVCSGAYLEEGAPTEGYLISSGNFINVWSIIQLSLIGCACCLGCLRVILAVALK